MQRLNGLIHLPEILQEEVTLQGADRIIMQGTKKGIEAIERGTNLW